MPVVLVILTCMYVLPRKLDKVRQLDGIELLISSYTHLLDNTLHLIQHEEIGQPVTRR